MLIAGFPAGMLAANCYLLAAGQGADCVIVDPGEDVIDRVTSIAGENGLNPVAAVLTHGHLDHAASFATVCAAFEIPGYLHAEDEYMLDEPLEALSPELRQMLIGYPIPAMRPAELRTLAPGAVLDFDGIGLTVRHTPGHTRGSVTLTLTAEGDRPDVLFTGDTLFAGSIGRTDLPGGSMTSLQASLGELLTESDEAIVLPGHGPRTTIGAERRANPFLADPTVVGRG